MKTGLIAALMNEYGNAITDLKTTITDIPDNQLSLIIDKETNNRDCVSVQSLLTHILFWGRNYMTMIDIHKGNDESPWRKRAYFDTIKDYNKALDDLLTENKTFFEGFMNSEMRQFDPGLKLKTGWGQLYDYEQLLEHGILHIYRHRWQIQKFKQLITKNAETTS